MSRKSKHRRRVRKNRRAQQGLENERLRALGLLPPGLPSELNDADAGRSRDHSGRWMNLRARGGQTISFVGTGFRVPIDFDEPNAAHVLTIAIAQSCFADSDES